jgi:hypothetical protein
LPAIGDFVEELVLCRRRLYKRLVILADLWQLPNHLRIQRFVGAFDLDRFTCIQNVVGYETQMLADQDEPQLNRRHFCIVFLDITVEYLQQLGVNQMEIFTNHYAYFVWLYRYNIHNLLYNVVPNQFRVASQK